MGKKLTSAEILEEELKELLDEKPEFTAFSQETLDKLFRDLKNSKEAKDYFLSRKIGFEAMDYFKLGYSTTKPSIVW